MGKPTDLVQGTLDLLILKMVALEPMHGWGIAQRSRQVSKEVLQVNQGALYPALRRLAQNGWIRAKWGESDNNRRAKFYSLTATGASTWTKNRPTGKGSPPPSVLSWKHRDVGLP